MVEDTPHRWEEYRRLVLSEIEGLRVDTKEIRISAEKAQRELAIELTKLKAEARIWGFIGGIVASAFIGGMIQILLLELG